MTLSETASYHHHHNYTSHYTDQQPKKPSSPIIVNLENRHRWHTNLIGDDHPVTYDDHYVIIKHQTCARYIFTILNKKHQFKCLFFGWSLSLLFQNHWHNWRIKSRPWPVGSHLAPSGLLNFVLQFFFGNFLSEFVWIFFQNIFLKVLYFFLRSFWHQWIFYSTLGSQDIAILWWQVQERTREELGAK